MRDELLSMGETLLALARENGADAADVVAVSGEGTDIELRDGQIEKLERDEGTVFGLRVFVGKSSAMTSGNVAKPASLRHLAENAVAMARLAPPDMYAGLAPAELLARDLPELDLAADALPESDALKQMALDAEEAARAVSGVTRSAGASASSTRRRIAVLTSNGFTASYARSGLSVSVSAVAGDGTAMERDYDYSSAIHPEDLRSPADVGQRAGERAVRRLNPRKLASCRVPVLYDRRVAGSLLGHLSGAINGAAVARGTSFLKDSLGQQIFHKDVMIWDDPLRRRGLGSKPCDGEGLPVRRRAMVEGGVLQSWFLDLRSARQLGLAPTGQAGRGVGGPPAPSSSNFYLEAGRETPAQMIAAMGRGLLVTEMLGSSINMVTGDYSRGASGYWIENGELACPVSEITIAGNLRDMFLHLTPASDLEFTSSTSAPSCRVDGLTIAGQ